MEWSFYEKHFRGDLPYSFQISSITSDFRNQVINWTSPMEVFPKMVPLLSIPQYRLDLLTGIIASVGGLTESLVSGKS